MMIWRAFAFVLFLGLAGCVSAPQQGASGTADYLSWPFEQSDIKPDPGIKFGVLANGMRYAIVHNAQPEHSASVRLRIAAGSLMEEDDQQGLAHFLEHMAFNGSKNFAEGEAVKALQRKGLAFGPHTNAYTSFTETVYSLELPSTDESTIETGLRFMRDVADGLLLDPAAIDRERGVVQSEERRSDTPEWRSSKARWKLLYNGHRAASRLPIGEMDVIRNAPRERIAAFYERYYRPERSTLIVVGDVDPAALEARIEAGFSSWERSANADANFGRVARGPTVFAQRSEPNLPDDVTIGWEGPPDDAPDNAENRRVREIRNVAFAVFNRRLGTLARSQEPPFVTAALGRSGLRGAARVDLLTLTARPGGWRTAMAAVEQEVRRALTYGVQQSEVDRELAVLRAAERDAASRADTRYDADIANQISSDLRTRRVTTNPREDLALFEQAVAGLKAESVNALLREALNGEPAMVFVSSASPVENGDEGVRQAFASSRAVAVAAPAAIETPAFPYTSFGAPGAVVSRSTDAALDVMMVSFANGVKLNVKHTDFENDTVGVKVSFAGGYLALPHDKVGLYWALPFAFIEGGLSKLTTEELERSVAGRMVEASLDLDEDAFQLTGSTTPQDFVLEMQMLAAYATDPAYRPAGLARLQAAAENYIKQYNSSPGRVLSREVPAILRSGDDRWSFPKLEQIRARNMDDLRAVLAPILAGAPVEITIVGDVDVEAAIAATAQTFGALPARRARAQTPLDIRFPARRASLTFEHEGRADQATAYTAWAGPDFKSNPRLARTVSLLRDMIKVRLTEEFREVQGATYSPSASSWASGTVPGFGFLSVSAETPPAQVEAFYKTVDAIAEEMRTGAFSDDVILRARQPILESAQKDRLTNNFWFNALEAVQSKPWTRTTIATFMDDMRAISKDEIVKAARRFLSEGRRVDIRVLPKKTP